MNDRKLKVLTVLAGVLAVGEFLSAVQIGLGKEPWGAGFAVIFGVFFLIATWLLRSGRVTAGAIFTGVLCLFEVIGFPSWHKHGALPSPAPSGPGAPLTGHDDLTAREREVLDLLAEGASNRQIARALDLSLKTVQNHVSRILDKLQAADRTQAALRACQAGRGPQSRK